MNLDRRRMFTLLSAAMAAHGLGARPVPRPERLALVIGNAQYRDQPLKNPVNDARAVAEVLRALQFRVLQGENLGLRQLVTTIQNFTSLAREHDVRLMYFAGHGMQVRGRNLLIPTDALVQSPEVVATSSIDLADVLDRLAQIRGGLNIVIVDACRNNPFNTPPAVNTDGQLVHLRKADLGTKGLAEMEAPSGTVIAFSTAPGRVAIDSAAAPNSVYAKHLLTQLRVPGLPIEDVFKRVRSGVMAETQNLQVPWESSSLTGEFCFSTDTGLPCGLPTHRTSHRKDEPAKLRMQPNPEAAALLPRHRGGAPSN